MKRLCVFCGSRTGATGAHQRETRELARLLVERGIGLVYGGGRVGLMGVLADAVLDAGGEVVGVIPVQLERREVAHDGVSAMEVVESMHERKARMAELSDGFVMLPGGYGTLDEFFEMATWAQLGFQAKPLGILNVDGFFDDLILFLDRLTTEGYVPRKHRDLVLVEYTSPALLDRMGAFAPGPGRDPGA